ncbi:hypothetical protein [Enhygromyxa salina]|uniref:hypothetical protein n=1 Tax=Enhygromyxa salina TaxID=215803 RepID=UPI0011B28227|nr:hypothetical protein [Enhygromyxa salina]
MLRRVPAEGEARAALWVLDGGPGFAGDSFLDENLVQRVREAHVDLLIPSHRGTVGQSALHCSAQAPDSIEAGVVTVHEWPSCLAELEEQWGVKDFRTVVWQRETPVWMARNTH